ncbi:MAG: hypothetical protein ACI9JL_003583 [Paracoccaceae bacterium]|jgi:hypothetical protein
MLRRDILRSGIAIACAATLSPLAAPAQAAKVLSEQPATTGAIKALRTALRAIGGDVCIDAAQRLGELPDGATTFTLHLRQAGLDGSDAGLLATALQSLGTKGGTSLDSFSLSYNSGIGDAGATSIAYSLPTTLPELGMVGCDLGDQAGEALLHWARQTSNLHTMCIEQNRFSEGLKTRFNDLARQRSNFLMVV